MGIVREEEVRTGNPRRTESDIARIVSQVLDEQKTKVAGEKDLEAMKNGVKELRELLCDENGKCIVATRQEFEAWKTEERKRTQEREERGNLPKMNETLRAAMTPGKLSDRNRAFARMVEERGGSPVDSFNYIKNDPENFKGLKRQVLKMLKPEEVEDFLTKCFVGPDGKIICSGMGKKGFRIQKQQDGKDNWETLGLAEEEEKKEKETAKHFW